jgi:hypothetical protein
MRVAQALQDAGIKYLVAPYEGESAQPPTRDADNATAPLRPLLPCRLCVISLRASHAALPHYSDALNANVCKCAAVYRASARFESCESDTSPLSPSTRAADAQMAYLYRTKAVSLVISEDSDLLVYGCKVLTKMDR